MPRWSGSGPARRAVPYGAGVAVALTLLRGLPVPGLAPGYGGAPGLPGAGLGAGALAMMAGAAGAGWDPATESVRLRNQFDAPRTYTWRPAEKCRKTEAPLAIPHPFRKLAAKS